MKYKWNDTDKVKRSNRRETSPFATLSTINSTCAGLRSSTGLCGERPEACGLSSGTLGHCYTHLNSDYFVDDSTLWDKLSGGISECKLKLKYKSDFILKRCLWIPRRDVVCGCIIRCAVWLSVKCILL